MTTSPAYYTRAETRRDLIAAATRVAWGEPHAANIAREIVPLLAAECCPDALSVFFNRLVPALRDGRTGSADLALEELLGGGAS